MKYYDVYNLLLFATPWTIQSVEFSRPEYWSDQPFPSPGDLPNPGIKPRSPALQADSLPAEPPGKPKKTGVGSLPLLQGTFLTQELNQGFLRYKQILYQLSYQGSPYNLLQGSPITETYCPMIQGGADVIIKELNCKISIVCSNHQETIPL